VQKLHSMSFVVLLCNYCLGFVSMSSVRICDQNGHMNDIEKIRGLFFKEQHITGSVFLQRQKCLT